MSIQSTRQPAILTHFIQSEIFDPHLLSDLIPSVAGDRSSAILLNSIQYHPDFQNQPQLDRTCKIFKKRRADQTFGQLTARKFENTAALQRSFEERNPYLLKKLAISNIAFSKDIFDHFQGQVEAHEYIELLHVIYSCWKDSTSVRREHLLQAIQLNRVHLVWWLVNRFPSLVDAEILIRAFQSSRWNKMVPEVLLPTSAKQDEAVLFSCAKYLLSQTIPKMDLFFRLTEAKHILKKEDWGKLLSICCWDVSEEIFAWMRKPECPVSISFQDLKSELIARLLVVSVRSHFNREAKTQWILDKIPTDRMKDTLYFCSEKLGVATVEEMRFFLQHTEAAKKLSSNDWNRVLESEINESVFFYLINLKNQLSISLDLLNQERVGEALIWAFKTPDWEENVLLILDKIHPNKMGEALHKCARFLKEMNGIKFQFFLARTPIRELATEESWGSIFEDDGNINIRVASILLNPENRILLSSEIFRQIAFAIARNRSWEVLDSIFQQRRAQEDFHFLLGMTKILHDKLYQEYLDPHFHELQHRTLFQDYEFSPLIRKAVQLNCLKILHVFIDSPEAKDATCYRYGRKEYVVPTALLEQMSNSVVATDPELKRKLDLEMGRRKSFWTQAGFLISSFQTRKDIL